MGKRTDAEPNRAPLGHHLIRLERNAREAEGPSNTLRRHQLAALTPLRDAATGPSPETMRHAVRPEDVAGTRNAQDALKRMAIRNGGTVHLGEAAKTMVEAGVTRSKEPANVLFNLRQNVGRHPEEWENLPDGYVRWTTAPPDLLTVRSD